jgi:cell shape-determining protein MreC
VQAHHYLIVLGMIVSILLAFAGFYNSVISRRFESVEAVLRDHQEAFEKVNARCMEEVAHVAGTIEQLKAMVERLDRLEAKLDRVLNGRLK